MTRCWEFRDYNKPFSYRHKDGSICRAPSARLDLGDNPCTNGRRFTQRDMLHTDLDSGLDKEHDEGRRDLTDPFTGDEVG